LRGSGALSSPYHYTTGTWLRERGRDEGGLRSLPLAVQDQTRIPVKIVKIHNT